jgi:peptide/nickel transport system ATP-binding protein
VVTMPPGCPFTPRCPLARERCEHEEPELTPATSSEHSAACHFSHELVEASAEQLFGTREADTSALAEFVEESGGSA